MLLPEGASLQVGDRFRLVTAGAVVGSFDQLQVPDVDGMRLNVTYEPDSVNVRVVPAALSDQTPT
ncbi:MAG: hypothetical protein GWN07_14405, partial [Actinobacteria bacterium]|nr:hypothetical protein [Actinomycetota bacterium]NIS31560.1 hypothetical protein [Actinomycetota bacterium]NIT95762.1 hypothetical protein [Actinomycetota bacterium]NIU64082.1 hypothetical protein [Actinomycetota bacterium]NIV55933.1 hypothetical protein [Actinomycetota bacterium]